MISLKDYILESVENIQTTDLEAFGDWIYGLEKTKLNSGKVVYWADARSLASCFLPGVGKVNTKQAKDLLNKLNKKVSKDLKVDIDELYGEFNHNKYTKRTIESNIHLICDTKTKAAAQKMERALDYVVIIKLGYVDDAIKSFKERDIQNNLANFLGINNTDILVESETKTSGVVNHNGEKYNILYTTYSAYMTYDELENVLKSL